MRGYFSYQRGLVFTMWANLTGLTSGSIMRGIKPPGVSTWPVIACIIGMARAF